MMNFRVMGTNSRFINHKPTADKEKMASLVRFLLEKYSLQLLMVSSLGSYLGAPLNSTFFAVSGSLRN